MILSLCANRLWFFSHVKYIYRLKSIVFILGVYSVSIFPVVSIFIMDCITYSFLSSLCQMVGLLIRIVDSLLILAVNSCLLEVILFLETFDIWGAML